MEKIKSITEAFSMQPISHIVCVNKAHFDNGVHNSNCVCKIEPETRQVNSEKEVNYYVGYNFLNNKLFEYPQESVSVIYSVHP